MLAALTMILPRLLFAQDSTAARLEQLMQAYATARGFNGSVLVARGGTILLQKGYGWQDAAQHLPNTSRTRYQIASTTKTFTSTMVLRLAAASRLSLTDKLSRWYPGLPFADSVTIQQMLTHTSGIWDFTRGDIPTQADEKKMIAIFRTHPLDFTPGTDWRYSNSNYVLLGYIIGRIMGTDYFSAVRRTIFVPLQMTASGFDFGHLHSGNKAIGYKTLNDTMAIPDEVTDSSVPAAAGSIYSSVEDMYRWHRALEDEQILPEAWQEKAYRNDHGYGYGYGWTVDSLAGKRVVSHSGSISGFGSDFERVPADDVCVVVLSNRGGSTTDCMHISRALLSVIYGQPYGLPHRWVTHVLPVAEMQRYAGVYQFPGKGLDFRVWVEDSSLHVQSVNRPGPRATLLAVGPDHFIIKEDEDVESWFDTTAGTFTFTQMGKTFTGQKRK